MSKKQMTLVYYYIPQDHDDQQTPNVFGVMTSKNNIRLQHIYDNFPLKGSYIFRFKVMYDNTIAWLDLPDLDAKLPTYKDKILIKCTRISWENNKDSPYGHYRFIKRQAGTTPTNPLSAKKQPVKQQTQPQSKSSQKSAAQPPLVQAKVSTNLLDQKHEVKAQTKIDFGDHLDLLSGSLNSPPKQATTDLTGLGDLKF